MAINKVRRKIVAGNWKMNKTISEAIDLANSIKRELQDGCDMDVVLCPPYTALKAVGDVIMNTRIKLGAQNMHWESYGAFTGEICAAMLRDLYCHYVILGHSERRIYFGETDRSVNQKAKAAISSHLTPIVCVGETLDQREGGNAKEIVASQIRDSLDGLNIDLGKVIIAYEPVWAIGTGRTATPAQAQEMHAYIRDILSSMVGEEIAQSIRIQYGGSMKPANAQELLSQPDIDGGLIGGAALDGLTFVEIIKSLK